MHFRSRDSGFYWHSEHYGGDLFKSYHWPGFASDAELQYRPLFSDTTVEIGKSYYYRVIAYNSAGISEPSTAVVPVSVECKTLVVEMQDMQFIHKHSGNLSLEVKQAHNFKEDAHRIKGTLGDFIIFNAEPSINS